MGRFAIDFHRIMSLKKITGEPFNSSFGFKITRYRLHYTQTESNNFATRTCSKCPFPSLSESIMFLPMMRLNFAQKDINFLLCVFVCIAVYFRNCPGKKRLVIQFVTSQFEQLITYRLPAPYKFTHTSSVYKINFLSSLATQHTNSSSHLVNYITFSIYG